MLDAQRLGARPYSLSALQKFSPCPYQFLLSAIYRLEPNRGARAAAAARSADQRRRSSTKSRPSSSARCGRGRLPLTAAGVADALAVLDRVLDDGRREVRGEPRAGHRPRLARRDRRDRPRPPGLGADGCQRPGLDAEYFEFSFGLSDEGPRRAQRRGSGPHRRPLHASRLDRPDRVEGRIGDLRITDHKTGRNRTTPRTVIGGGATLQPVLYSLAVEQVLGSPVSGGRLFYCTAAGRLHRSSVPLNEANRRAGLEALEIIDRAIELGSCRPRPRSGPAPGATSARSAVPTSRCICAASRPSRSAT